MFEVCEEGGSQTKWGGTSNGGRSVVWVHWARAGVAQQKQCSTAAVAAAAAGVAGVGTLVMAAVTASCWEQLHRGFERWSYSALGNSSGGGGSIS